MRGGGQKGTLPEQPEFSMSGAELYHPPSNSRVDFRVADEPSLDLLPAFRQLTQTSI